MIKRIITSSLIHSLHPSTIHPSPRITRSSFKLTAKLLQSRQVGRQFSSMSQQPQIKESSKQSPHSILKAAAIQYHETQIQEIREGITILMRKKLAPKNLEELETVLLKLLYFSKYQNVRDLQRTFEVEKLLFRIQAEIKQLYPHFSFTHIFALLKVAEVCPLNYKSLSNKLYSEIYEGKLTFNFDQFAFLSQTPYAQENKTAQQVLSQVCIGLLRQIPGDDISVALNLQSLVQLGLLIQSAKPGSQFWALFQHLLGTVGSQFNGTLKKQVAISLLQLLSRNRIIQIDIWSFIVSHIMKHVDARRVTLKDLSAICQAISFSNMQSQPVSERLRKYILSQEYETQDLYKFLNYKQVVSLISGLYSLNSDGERDNLDRILNGYIQSNLSQMSMMLVDKLQRIKSARVEERVREKITQEYRKLERDIQEFKDIEEMVQDEKERRRIIAREEYRMENGRDAIIEA